jgi:hypothetical protein
MSGIPVIEITVEGLTTAVEPTILKNCMTCGVAFIPIRRNARFCSKACSHYNTPPRACELCGDTFRAPDSNPGQRFCSNKCSYQTRERRLQRRVCAVCGAAYQPRWDVQRTCSRACGYAIRPKSAITPRACLECGTVFTPSRPEGIYCSRKCSGVVKSREQDKRVSVVCVHCDNVFLAKRSQNARYCSLVCRSRHTGPSRGQRRRLATMGARTRVCEQCGSSFTADRAQINLRFCSNMCSASSRRLYASKTECARVHQARRMLDPVYRLHDRMSSSVRGALQRRGLSKASRRLHDLVGYTTDQLAAHLERQFTKGMSWRNRGSKWHIDHIIPLASFQFTSANDPEFRAAWALTNLRPLWKPANLSKGAKRLTLL